VPKSKIESRAHYDLGLAWGNARHWGRLQYWGHITDNCADYMQKLMEKLDCSIFWCICHLQWLNHWKVRSMCSQWMLSWAWCTKDLMYAVQKDIQLIIQWYQWKTKNDVRNNGHSHCYNNDTLWWMECRIQSSLTSGNITIQTSQFCLELNKKY